MLAPPPTPPPPPCPRERRFDYILVHPTRTSSLSQGFEFSFPLGSQSPGTADKEIAGFPTFSCAAECSVLQKPLHPECQGLDVGAACGKGGGRREGKGAESAALLLKVDLRRRAVVNGHELFEVLEERDEEVAAFCHMLDV